jgi:uncharacterized Zn-finger protein
VRPYRCEICGKDFTSKYTFKAHEKVHTNRERNFTCINCGKAFLTEQNLIHHERTHSGLKNYVCQKCGKCTIQLFFLYINKTHQKIIINFKYILNI